MLNPMVSMHRRIVINHLLSPSPSASRQAGKGDYTGLDTIGQRGENEAQRDRPESCHSLNKTDRLCRAESYHHDTMLSTVYRQWLWIMSVGIISLLSWIRVGWTAAHKVSEIDKAEVSESISIFNPPPYIEAFGSGAYQCRHVDARESLGQSWRQNKIGLLDERKLWPEVPFREGRGERLSDCSDGRPTPDCIGWGVANILNAESYARHCTFAKVAYLGGSDRYVSAFRDAEGLSNRPPLQAREYGVQRAYRAQANLREHRWRVPAFLTGLCLFILGFGLGLYSAERFEEPCYGRTINRNWYLGFLLLSGIVMFAGLILSLVAPRLL